jgi:hypothetical protein
VYVVLAVVLFCTACSTTAATPSSSLVTKPAPARTTQPPTTVPRPSATYQIDDGYTVSVSDVSLRMTTDTADAAPGSTLVFVKGSLSFTNETPGHNLSGGISPTVGIALPGQSCGTDTATGETWSWTTTDGQPICLLATIARGLPGEVENAIPTLSFGASYILNFDQPIFDDDRATIMSNGLPSNALIFYSVETLQSVANAPIVFFDDNGVANNSIHVVIPGS